MGQVGRAALGTGFSRITGLLRDAAIAYAFGASPSYDAFLVAMFIPQALRQVIGEAGLASAFIPVYAKARERGEGAALARAFLLCLLLILPPLCLCGSLLARWYVPFLAAGFTEDKMATAVELGARLFPLIAFVSLAALEGAVLNAHGHFFLPALAPAVMNLGIVAGALLLSRLFSPAILGLVAGTMAGGLSMVLLLGPAFLRKIPAQSPTSRVRQDLREVGRRLLPALGGLMVMEANTLVDNRLASYLPHGSIATLQYAMRLFQLPLGVMAVSVASAALPAFSRHLARGEEEGFRQALTHSLLLTSGLMIPASLGLGLISRPLVAVLFQRGAFSGADTLRTVQNLLGYLPGLWAYSLVYLFSRAFFALGRPTLPLLGGALSLAVNIGLNLWWVRIWGAFGLALATGVSGWVDALVLGFLLQRRTRGWIRWKQLGLVGIASAVMAGVVWASVIGLKPLGPWVQVGLAVPLGLLTYLGVSWKLGIVGELRASG